MQETNLNVSQNNDVTNFTMANGQQMSMSMYNPEYDAMSTQTHNMTYNTSSYVTSTDVNSINLMSPASYKMQQHPSMYHCNAYDPSPPPNYQCNNGSYAVNTGSSFGSPIGSSGESINCSPPAYSSLHQNGSVQNHINQYHDICDLNISPFDPSQCNSQGGPLIDSSGNMMCSGISAPMYINGQPRSGVNGGHNHGLLTSGYQMTNHNQQQQPCYLPPYQHSSPAGSSHTSTGSEESDDVYFGLKRSPAAATVDAGKRSRQTKKRKPKKDPNEPQKPVSAYALFFRDTQAAIKGSNPNASFGEVSKIVASMWDALDSDSKNVYKQKTEVAKKDYLKQLAAYRASQVSKGGASHLETFAEFSQAQRKYGLIGSNGINQTPDSTTGNIEVNNASINAAQINAEIGAKSLASLIAAPSPQHILTATTTLTVPQNYLPSRKSEDVQSYEPNGSKWEQNGAEYNSEGGMVVHCRDIYSGWVHNNQTQNGTFAPV